MTIRKVTLSIANSYKLVIARIVGINRDNRRSSLLSISANILYRRRTDRTGDRRQAFHATEIHLDRPPYEVIPNLASTSYNRHQIVSFVNNFKTWDAIEYNKSVEALVMR